MWQIIAKLVSNPKKLFLVDSVGAFMTAFFLAVVLPTFEEYVGMPKKILVPLSTIALVYALYSALCYYFTDQNWRLFLKSLCIANLLYCFLTTGLLILFYSSLTTLGVMYFLIEIALIGVLITIERKALKYHVV
ncbi:MAG: hypothetical protein KA713_15815 [Chryseotalea sp. WA131a]|jgi:hypothetical protein|nr:MAG: hypothetical protein KA713_15815 [Chryseotalea sp. WA131a]